MTEILKEFEKDFDKLRKDLKFKVTLDELDKIFYLRDLISKEGYVSQYPAKQICRRIIDVYSSWTNYLHGILMPNPGSIISVTESQSFGEDEREKITKLIDKIMMLSTDFNLIVLNGDVDEGKFIDEAYSFWKNECSPELNKIMSKIGKRWESRLKAKPVKEDKDFKTMYG